jgi:hypothetical protein
MSDGLAARAFPAVYKGRLRVNDGDVVQRTVSLLSEKGIPNHGSPVQVSRQNLPNFTHELSDIAINNPEIHLRWHAERVVVAQNRCNFRCGELLLMPGRGPQTHRTF